MSSPAKLREIVRAAIHPGIGIARIGNSVKDYYVCPEVTAAIPHPNGFYRDKKGALKRGAARFRIYGYDADDKVVQEITSSDADITWRAHLANQKSAWYYCAGAPLDIPEMATHPLPRRNPEIPPAERKSLVIDPGPARISGRSAKSGPLVGKFKNVPVCLGELRTDRKGRLLVLGGRGASGSPSGVPVVDTNNQDALNNAPDWYDDISDGPISAKVKIGPRAIPVDGAWVAVVPPTYAPDIVGWRTMYDVLSDLYIGLGWMKLPPKISFTEHVLPILRGLTDLQWVNKGFAAVFGHGAPWDFSNPALLSRLAQTRSSRGDPYQELRQRVFSSFRWKNIKDHELQRWPWIYGDGFQFAAESSPENDVTLTKTQQQIMQLWVAGDFIDDYRAHRKVANDLAAIPVEDQPGMLDRAAMHYCCADVFHPGPELTWPMRHRNLYTAPFRIRRRKVNSPEPDCGPVLTATAALSEMGPLSAQSPGGLTRWLGLPWQCDAASCRAGYDSDDPYLPAYWPSRLPNHIICESQYREIMDPNVTLKQRTERFQDRYHWLRTIETGDYVQEVTAMVTQFATLGVVEARPGIRSKGALPTKLYVESRPTGGNIACPVGEGTASKSALRRAGWRSRRHYEQYRQARFSRPIATAQSSGE